MRRFIRNTNIQPEEIIFKNLSFSEALRLLKEGKKVARDGWDGKDRYIKLDKKNLTYSEEASDTLKKVGDAGTIYLYSNLEVKPIMIWPCNQIDVLSHDWYVLG